MFIFVLVFVFVFIFERDKFVTRSPIQQPTVCFFGVFVFVGVRRNRMKVRMFKSLNLDT